jgi:hypothetical protein
MDIKNNTNNEPKENQKQSDDSLDTKLKAETNNELSEVKKTKRVRREATAEQLSNPLHGVKLKDLLERLVEHYGWEYLGDRTNIKCFMFNPTMKSSLGFLRKTTWAREFVEDIYVDMVEKR